MRSRPLKTQVHGVVLIIVLWIITLLMVIAASFIQTMRTDINVVGNSISRIKAETLADAAMQRAIYELYKPQNLDGRWNADGSMREWNYRELIVNITMQEETGRIDINRANDRLLQGLFQSQGATEEDALKLVAAIADWRDADNFRRLNGAEAAEYAAAGLSYGPANAPFQAVEELKKVLGMTLELYTKLAPYITVFSGQAGINELIATREVLRALPNVNDEQIDDYLSRRDLARANRQPVPNFPQNAFRSLSNANTPTRIRTDAKFEDGSRFIREVVVRRYNDPRRPYALLQWKEGRDLIESENAVATNANGANPETTGNTPASTLGKIVPPNGKP